MDSRCDSGVSLRALSPTFERFIGVVRGLRVGSVLVFVLSVGPPRNQALHLTGPPFWFLSKSSRPNMEASMTPSRKSFFVLTQSASI